ncbi:MAG: hypothetical protein RL199_415 [Pseudomonadota bacterium]|jgi:hypothetical protein
MRQDGAMRFGMTMAALAFAVSGGAPLAVAGAILGYRMYERVFP